MTFSNGEQRLELRDTKGTTLGFFLSERELQEQSEERDALRKQVADLQFRLDEMARDREALRKTIENYTKILDVWEQDGIAPMTRKELEHLRKDGLPFQSVIAEIEELVRSPSGGA